MQRMDLGDVVKKGGQLNRNYTSYTSHSVVTSRHPTLGYMAYLSAIQHNHTKQSDWIGYALPCPLPGCRLVPLPIGLVQVRDIGHKRIVGVRVSEH